MNEETLSSLLSKNQAKTYLALLKFGQGTGTSISDYAKVHRRNVYDALRKLENMGLVSSITKGKFKYYTASPPSMLMSLLAEKQANIQEILPELNKEYKKSKTQEKVSVYHGEIGKIMMSDIEKENPDELLICGATLKLFDYEKYSYKRWINNIKSNVRLLLLDSPDAKKRFEMLKKHAKGRYKVKLMPKTFSSPIAWGVGNNTTMLNLWGDNPLLIKIESEEFAKSFKNYFELLWKTMN